MEALSAEKKPTALADITPGMTFTGQDGEVYEMTPEAIKFGEDLSISMAKDIVRQVEEQKRQLILKIFELTQALEQQKKEQADIYYYLNKKLDDNYETIARLEEQLITEQGDREVAEKLSERKIDELNSKLGSEEVRFTSRISALESKLDGVREYSENKEKTEKQIADLQTTIENERIEFQNLLDSVEMRALKEKIQHERLFEEKAEALKREYLEKVEAGISDKTRETLQENLRVKMELSSLTREADDVRAINASIFERDRDMRNELSLSQSAEKELLKRLGTYQHLIKQLTEKNGELEQKFEAIELQKVDRLQQHERGFIEFVSNYYNQYISTRTMMSIELDEMLCEIFEVLAIKYPKRLQKIVKRLNCDQSRSAGRLPALGSPQDSNSLTSLTRSVATQTESLGHSGPSGKSMAKKSSSTGFSDEILDTFGDLKVEKGVIKRKNTDTSISDIFLDDMQSVQSLDISGTSVGAVSLNLAGNSSIGSTSSSSHNRVTVAHSENAKYAKKRQHLQKSLPRKLYGMIKSPASPLAKDITMSLVGQSIHATSVHQAIHSENFRSPSIPILMKQPFRKSISKEGVYFDDVDDIVAGRHDVEEDNASGLVSPSSSVSMSPRLHALDSDDL